MMIFNRSILLVVALLALSVAGANEAACPFLPVESAPPIELTLPESVFTHPELDLPLKFEGVTPVITRRTVPFGSTPKVTIERYSATPTITYDEVEGMVVVRSEACSAEGGLATEENAEDTEEDRIAAEDDTEESGAFSSKVTWMAVAGSALMGLMDESMHSYALTAALAALLVPGAMAHEGDVCLPSVQVVIEAPQGYVGAAELCWEEINDPAICPDPYPQFETSDEIRPDCTVAVVGAAAGGLYTATRLVDSGKVPADEVCIFEWQGRVGGRAYSLRGLGPDNDLTVDAGGYRTWPRFTPTLQALITEYLDIPVACYDDSDPCTKYTIVDDDGEKSGFATMSEAMLEKMIDAGARWFPYHELVKLEKMDEAAAVSRNFGRSSPTKLYFANGVEATASSATILNTPQRPLMNIVRNSNFDETGVLDLPKLKALHSVQTTISTKLYLYYPRGHVFWYKLGMMSGDYEFPGDAQNMLLAGRYSDGHVRCDDPSDLDTCHGFLLAVYATDFSGNKAQYFRRFQRERPEPVTFISNKDLEGSEFLKHAHERLEEYHMNHVPDAPYSGYDSATVFAETEPPTFAVLANWNTAVPWVGGGYHGWTDVDNLDLAMEPFVEHDIYVVTEAFSMLHGWAEGSIKVADRVLERYMDVPRPWDFPVEDVVQRLRATDSVPCAGADDGHGGSSGGGDGGVSGPPASISLGEVQLHASEDDCWSVLHGTVYDLTALVASHPGGADSIIAVCGIDGSSAFDEHHSTSLLTRVDANTEGPLAISWSDVTLHDSPEDCWSILYGNVYDLTRLVTNHTGPSGPIIAVCGGDGTEKFDGKHGSRPELLEHLADDMLAPLAPLTLYEVALHSAEDDCWSVIHGTVYDLTLLVTNHTGPSGPVAGTCGTDGTEAFDGHHAERPELLANWSMTHHTMLGELVVVSDESPEEDTSDSGGSYGGTPVSSNTGGVTTGDEEDVDPFCFTAEALVEMADGTLKSIKDIKEGDVVSTGTGVGAGLVTEKLIHPIHSEVPVSIIDTEYGELVGTPTHPMYYEGSWTELGKLGGCLVKMATQHVDFFYNLEIDAIMPGESSHSYVVNGMVASGLGDNEDLNRMQPRQDVWKNKI